MSKRHLIIATVAATAAAVVLTACSSSGTSPSHSMTGTSMSAGATMSGMAGRPITAGAPATGPHNTADVTFATDMIPHHAQALEMANMALTASTNPKVKQLASTIRSEQTPEIRAMSGWLKGWNGPVPDTSMGGMDMDGTAMPGMMSAADMSRLKSATGTTFDRLFLAQMITHHTGALTMANAELSDGRNHNATTLAKSIINGQTKEIAQMKALLPTIK